MGGAFQGGAFQGGRGPAGGRECPDAMAKSQVQKAKGSPLELGNVTVEYGNDITYNWES